MPKEALVLVAAAVLEARDQPSTYSSRCPGRHVPTIVDQIVSFTILTAARGAKSLSQVGENDLIDRRVNSG
jgi:hypothetical protein